VITMKGSTVHLSLEVKRELDQLKIHHRESYDDVLRRMLKMQLPIKRRI